MTNPADQDGPAWTPSPARIAAAQVTRFTDWLSQEHGLTLGTYDELWRWSVTDAQSFWIRTWEYFQLRSSAPVASVFTGSMTDQHWFTGARLNYAEHALLGGDEHTALVCCDESGQSCRISRRELRAQAAALAASLSRVGVRQGDRVAAILPNRAEAVIGFLAAASIGAIWSLCSPDLGEASIAGRFGQISPKVLIAADGYRYGGKFFDITAKLERVRDAIGSIQVTVLVPAVPDSTLPGCTPWQHMLAEAADPAYAQVPFDHPLWVVYTSGTTGPPKPIVHGHGGILLALNVFLALHLDIDESDLFFWHTSTGWVMWNTLVGGLLRGAACVLYDGSPAFPGPDVLWQLAAREKITVMGVGAAYLQNCLRQNLSPAARLDLTALRTLGSTGSPLSPEACRWALQHVASDMLVASVSGGTDICCAWVGSCPSLPVYAGEIQVPVLGAAVAVYDEAGKPAGEKVGELVVTRPFPSMPVSFWNDPDGTRMRSSYFEPFAETWRHGDWARRTSHGGFVIHGRSDATLNRGGIRMGTSEFYSVSEAQPEIADSLVVDVSADTYSSELVLFVELAPGCELTPELESRVRAAIRQQLSPRHAPDRIIVVPEIPYTLTGKKCEVPVKRILEGRAAQDVSSDGALRTPGLLEQFAAYRRPAA